MAGWILSIFEIMTRMRGVIVQKLVFVGTWYIVSMDAIYSVPTRMQRAHTVRPYAAIVSAGRAGARPYDVSIALYVDYRL